ncbi:CHAT domain-containing protein [Streptomyces sp. B6B3]|uniref:CHAT domain-containing protein n=1 Tax=Streptomyces sp. B6B3 TaxID=3153570 RepID=UPI00325F05FD
MTDDSVSSEGTDAVPSGIRDWAAVATSQADVLLRGGGEGLDQVVDQLATIERLLPADDRARAAVVPRLGGLLALRGHRGDHEAALPHLRWTHRNGADTDPLAVHARLQLLQFLRPTMPDGASLTGEIGEAALFGGGTGGLEDSLRRHTAEVLEILDRLDAAPLPEPTRQRLAYLRRVSEGLAPDNPDFAGTMRDLAGAAPDGTHPAFRMLMWLFGGESGPDAAEELARWGVTGPDAGRMADLLTRIRAGGEDDARQPDALRAVVEGLDEMLDGLPRNTPARAEFAKMRSYLRMMLGVLDPGSTDWNETDAAAAEPVTEDAESPSWPGRAAQERSLVAQGDMLRALREGDPELLERAAARIIETIDVLPEDSREAQSARADLASLLSHAEMLSGSLQDADASVAMTRAIRGILDRDLRGPLPNDALMNLQLTVSGAFREMDLANRTGDPSVHPRLIAELTGLYEGLPPDDEWRFSIALALGSAHREHGLRQRGPDRADHLRRARRYLREAADPEHAPPLLAAYRPVQRAVVLANVATMEPDREASGEAIAALRQALEGPRFVSHQEAVLRYFLGRTLLQAALLHEDVGMLDEGVTELERVHELAAAGRGAVRDAMALAGLSDAYFLRHHIGRHIGADPERVAADHAAALAAGRAALAEHAADVLLQLGTEHALATARSGASHALRVAHEAAHAGRAATAVEALELGRAMVLRAAAASRDVPGLLADAGHPELAEEWRGAVPEDLLRPEAAQVFLRQAADQSGPTVPSALRRRALDALGGQAPLGTPGVSELTAGLAACAADALVYLLPALGENAAGYALLLRPDRPESGEPTALRLPELTLANPVLRAYLDAAAERSRRKGDAEAEAAWRAALDELCDWAGPAVMGPVLAALPPRGALTDDAAEPPRLVLVPCGPLGAVAWHAARVPDGAERRYACERAVISYAPSGGEALRAAARRRLPVDDGQVLVADPSLTLVWSEIEAEALRAAHYPDALRYGEFPSAADGDDPPDAAGTPDDLLAVLPGGAGGTGADAVTPAVVHVACHAVAGLRPTRSALQLAGGEDGLTVARMLDRAAALPPEAAGPLVVLSACETDLSTRDHDEALTLATALVARGAADVVGSRWAVREGATAVLMAVFHHFLADRGLPPADALHAAQRWMLDRDRRPPPSLRDPLLREAGHPDLHHVHHWAAFTHQGNPSGGPVAPADPRHR